MMKQNMNNKFLYIFLSLLVIITGKGVSSEVLDLQRSGHFEQALKIARAAQDNDLISQLEYDVLYVGASTQLLFNEEGQPRATLLEILNKLGMTLNPDKNTLVEIADWSQKNLLRQGERWEPQSKKFESLRDEFMPLFIELGLVNEITPSFMKYDTAICYGALLSRVRLRLSYLVEQWNKGIRFNELVFLGGERPLNPDLENEKELLNPIESPLTLRKDWVPPQKLPTNEAEMEELVWNQSEIPQEMRNHVKVTFVNTPMQPIPKTPAYRRPTTDDTILHWLKEEKPKAGTYLFVSNGPYTLRQDLSARNMMPKNFGIDTIGDKTNPSLPVALYLDELARWIDQMSGYWERKHASITLSSKQLETISQLIWKNECGGTVNGLTSWNAGEQFASLGIGHFIWYPEGQKGPFVETFPAFISLLQNNGTQVPEWLSNAQGCPWNSRQEFLENFKSPKMVELRDLLETTKSYQALFMAERLEAALPKMTAALTPEDRKHATQQYFRIAQEPMGMYVLLDYLNFKGEGTSEKERYLGKGWGLLQVLLLMPSPSIQSKPIQDFVVAAKQLLAQRVVNSPPERNEKKWLQGWSNRLDTYTKITS